MIWVTVRINITRSCSPSISFGTSLSGSYLSWDRMTIEKRKKILLYTVWQAKSLTPQQDENLVDENFPLRLNVDKRGLESSHIDLNLIGKKNDIC